MPMFRRRSLPVLAAGLFIRPAAAATPAPIAFRMLREGRLVGSHRISFSEAGRELTATAEANVQVRIAGFTVFRLTHRAEEVWLGDRLQRFTSRLDRNGTITEFAVRLEGEALVLSGGAGPLRLPAQAAPLSWWDVSRFGRPLFDTDDGKPLRGNLTRSELPGGRVRWQYSAPSDESAAVYGPDGTWLEWATRGDDGSLVTYERG